MKTWALVLSVVSALVLLTVAFLVLFLLRKRWAQRTKKDESESFRKSLNVEKTTLKDHFLNIDMEEAASNIESEKPVIISLEEIEEATNSFDETRKIGEGGYGSVYFGIIRERDAAIKKMRSSKSKEFFAELKVLCRIHHNNVVQLLGYASGDNHLYLVYEYIQNGTLNDHLQDPLLKGNIPATRSENIYITYVQQTSSPSQMAETAFLCLSEDPANRPEMRDVVSILGQILMASIEWEASLGGTSQVFSGLFNGR